MLLAFKRGLHPVNFEPHPSLRSSEILADLDDAELRTLTEGGEEITCTEGETVSRRGEAGEHFHFVLDGCVQILVGEGSGRRVVKTHGPGGFFGEMSLLTGAEISADVVAAEATRLLRLDKGGFQALLSAHPQVLIRLTTALAHHIANTNRQFMERRLAPLTGFARHGDTLRDDATALHVAASIARQSNRTSLLVTLDQNLSAALERLGVAPPEIRGEGYDVASPEAIARHSLKLSDQLRVLPLISSAVAPASIHALLLAAREHHGAVLLDLGGSAPASLLPELRQCDHIHLLADKVSLPALTETVNALDLSPAQRPSRLRIAIVTGGDRRPRDVLSPVVEATGVKSLALLAPLRLENLTLDEQGLPALATDPITTRRIDSMAREAIGARIGIAMGSGGAKGFAHIGVMRVLEEIGVPVDVIVGCSMGAIMGAIFATGRDSVEVERMARRLWARKGAFFDWQIPPWANIVKGKKVDRMAENGFGDMEIIDCPIPYGAMGFGDR
jgi:NTE family protein